MGNNSRKYKYLAKNIGLLTLSSFATKILSFFLVPLYTNVLSTSQYGINDLFVTTIGLLVPIVTLNIQESVMRFSMDSKHEKKQILSVGMLYLIIGTVIVISLLIINSLTNAIELFKEYAVFFFLMFFSQALSGMIISYIRGIDRIADLSVSSVLNSVIIIICNILFLVVFKMGLIGYFWANIIGPFIQCIYLMIKGRVFQDTELKNIDADIAREMVGYSTPMIGNAVGWWINNAADKYVVIYFVGMAANGIYSVAAKIPSILNIFQSIFAQAWTLSAVKDYDPEDKSGFFANTYAVYNCAMTIGCSALIVLDKILARILYAKDFYAAWKYVPWLTVAIVFGSLSGYIGGFFSATKDSKAFGRSTLMGAFCNVILNFILTPVIGAMGAAIATTISYMMVWIVRLIHSKKYIKLRIRIKRDCCSYVLLVFQCFLVFLKNSLMMYFTQTVIFVVIIILYWKEVCLIINKIREIAYVKIQKI